MSKLENLSKKGEGGERGGGGGGGGGEGNGNIDPDLILNLANDNK